jgi:hypothetical protein
MRLVVALATRLKPGVNEKRLASEPGVPIFIAVSSAATFGPTSNYSQLNHPVAEGFGDGFGLGVDLQFCVDVLQVKVDGAPTEPDGMSTNFLERTRLGTKKTITRSSWLRATALQLAASSPV